MIRQGKAGYPVREAILHCSATKTGFWKNKSINEAWVTIDGWHRSRGWKAIGYHAVIMPDGEWFIGRPFLQIGAHVIRHNAGTIGICFLETYEVTEIGQFSDFFTTAQRDCALRILRHIPGLQKVSGHNDYAPKLCPGFKVHTSDWLQTPNNP